MRDLFQHISGRIDAIQGKPIRLVDFDLGQLEQEPMPPLSYPAVLVSFNAPAYTNAGAGVQQADTLITLRIAFRVWERTNNKTPTNWRDVGLAHLDVLRAIHTALHLSSGECFSPLVRVSFSNQQRADLRVYTYTYSCEYYDAPESQYTPWQDTQDEEGNPIPPPDLCVRESIESP